jgi:2-iminobutanoate/2-iminopropanoate deaminase
MGRSVLRTDGAPEPIGPYSQAVQVDAGRMTFLSGQVALDPKTGQLVPGEAAAQAERVMQNLGAVLASGGLGFEHVVRCTIYLTDLADFAQVNEVYGRHFKAPPPSRSTVQVSALPKGAKVEIDAIAVSGPKD